MPAPGADIIAHTVRCSPLVLKVGFTPIHAFRNPLLILVFLPLPSIPPIFSPSRYNAEMIIWGLDLNRIRFSAFKHSNMFNPRYYLRRQRFVAYQLAMIFTVVGECMATYTLDKYVPYRQPITS